MNKIEEALENIDAALQVNGDTGTWELDDTFNAGLFDKALTALQSGEVVVVDGEKLSEWLPCPCPSDVTEGDWESPLFECCECSDREHNRIKCWIAYLQKKDGE